MALSSYNYRKNNCRFDACCVTIVNVLTALLSATTIYCVLGHEVWLMNNCEPMVRELLKRLTQSSLSVEAAESLLKELTVAPSYFPDAVKVVELPKSMRFWYPSDRVILQLNSSLAAPLFTSKSLETRAGGVYRLMAGSAGTGALLSVAVCDANAQLERAGEGPGLAFVAFTRAIQRLPHSQVWNALFFLALFTLGLGSLFTTVEGVVTTLMDEFPAKTYRQQKGRRVWIAMVLCGFLCINGFVFVKLKGQYITIDLLDTFGVWLPQLALATLETAAVATIFGFPKLCQMAQACGTPLGRVWTVAWRATSPLLGLLLIMCALRAFGSTVTYSPLESYVAAPRSWQSLCIGACIAIGPFGVIPVFMVHHWCQKRRERDRAESPVFVLNAAPAIEVQTLPWRFESAV